MKMLICGGREYADIARMYDALDEFVLSLPPPREILVIHGDARGADHLAQGWAVSRGFQPVRVPALWNTHGARAGLMRNVNMLKLEPEIVFAFPGGRGTAHMVRIAKEAKIMVIEIS